MKRITIKARLKGKPKPKAFPKQTAIWIIENDENWEGRERTTCSKCKSGFSNRHFFEPWEFLYCPRCGRYMPAYVRR